MELSSSGLSEIVQTLTFIQDHTNKELEFMSIAVQQAWLACKSLCPRAVMLANPGALFVGVGPASLLVRDHSVGVHKC